MSRRSRGAGLLRGERGQALILTALALTGIMGGLALAVDVGYLHYEQRQLQTAADSAAIGAGMELGDCNKAVCDTMKTAAETALTEDGMVSSSSNITETQNSESSASSCSAPSAPSAVGNIALQINVAPCLISGDPNNGNPNMAEVVLVEKTNTFFGRIFGVHQATIMARAEAGDAYINIVSGGNCVYVKNGLTLNANANINLTNCGIYDGGQLTVNPSDSVSGTDFLYTGQYTDGCPSHGNGNNNCTFTLTDGETGPTKTTTTQSDPLAGYFTTPTVPSTSYSTNTVCNSNSSCTMSPGYYPYGYNINSNATMDMSPGLYYFNGSMNVDSNSKLTCSTCTNGAGVTLYFNNGILQTNSNSTVQLTAATTAGATNNAIPNLLLWGGSGMQDFTLDAESGSYYEGIIYLPNNTLTINSNSGLTMNSTSSASNIPTFIDVKSMILDSNQNLTVVGSSSLPGNTGTGQKLGTFALAE